MKRFIIITGFVLAVLFSATICANASTIIREGMCGDNVTWTLDSEGTLTISGTGDMEDSSWYSEREKIKSVVIENGVTSICEAAFYGCENLINVTIPNSITSIGYRAFYDCIGLTSITIPDSVTSIGFSAFYGCDRLRDVYILDLSAWCNIDFEDANSNPSCFANLYINNELATDITIPDSVTSIGNNAFWSCSSVTSITIPNSVTSIGEGAFRKCTSLTDITIPDSVTSIGAYAFSDCIGLTSITIPDSVTSIGEATFSYCSSLTSITIPDSVTSIGSWAFSWCTNLTDIYYRGTKTQWNTINIMSGNDNLTRATIHYNGDISTPTPTPTPMPNTTKIIGDKYVSIGDTDIIEGVYFTSDKQIRSAVFEIRYPSYLQLKSVLAKDFSIVQKSGEPQTSGNITTVRVLCQYSSNESADANTLVNPFDLVFDVSRNISPVNGTISISNATLNTAEGVSCAVDRLEEQPIIVSPCLVSSLQIKGDSEIYGSYQYSAIITPEYATNKNVIWSVDDNDIAEISQSGLLTAKRKGTVTIIAKSADGNASDRKKITVHAYATVSNITSDIGSWDKTFSSNNRNYTVYVDGTAQSVSFTVSAPVGTVYANDNLMLSGFPQEFSLTGEQTEIVFDVKDVADYEDGTYTVTVVRGGKYIKLNNTPQYSNGSYVFNAVSCNIDLLPNDKFIAAVYDDKGCLLGIGNANAINGTITVSCDTQACSYKVFLWDKLGGMKPICGSIEGLF